MNFSVISRLDKKEYIKIMYTGIYKKPAFILGTIIGAYLLITGIFGYMDIMYINAFSPFVDFILGLFLLSAPSLIVLLSVSQIKSNSSLLNDIIYSFTDSGMVVTGSTFKSEFAWEHIVKQKEIRRYLILYHTKKFGNFIDRSKLSPEQLDFIKMKIGGK